MRKVSASAVARDIQRKTFSCQFFNVAQNELDTFEISVRSRSATEVMTFQEAGANLQAEYDLVQNIVVGDGKTVLTTSATWAMAALVAGCQETDTPDEAYAPAELIAVMVNPIIRDTIVEAMEWLVGVAMDSDARAYQAVKDATPFEPEPATPLSEPA